MNPIHNSSSSNSRADQPSSRVSHAASACRADRPSIRPTHFHRVSPSTTHTVRRSAEKSLQFTAPTNAPTHALANCPTLDHSEQFIPRPFHLDSQITCRTFRLTMSLPTLCCSPSRLATFHLSRNKPTRRGRPESNRAGRSVPSAWLGGTSRPCRWPLGAPPARSR